MTTKIYCKNCKHHPVMCEKMSNLIIEKLGKPEQVITAKTEHTNCLFYKRIWWKFWVKEEQP